MNLSHSGGTSSSVRGIRLGGDTPTNVNVIDYVTLASTGDAQDFGDLTDARKSCKAISNNTRGVNAGGLDPGYSNILDYITIASTGNAADFGDLTVARARISGIGSDSHGGLQG